MRCGSCGCYITAERQKGHAYYRCTKKKGPCAEKSYLREEALVEQMRSTLIAHSIPDDWADNMLKEVEREREAARAAAQGQLQGYQGRITALAMKLDRLLDAKLESSITVGEYAAKKGGLLTEKLGLEEQAAKIQRQGSAWLEPMREFILASKHKKKDAEARDPATLRHALKNIGSNFLLQSKTLRFSAGRGWRIAPAFRTFSDWCRFYEKIRTEFQGGG